MILVDLGYLAGKLADVAADPLGWIVVFQDEATGHLELVQLDPEGNRRVPDVPLPAGGGAAFPRVHVDANRQTWLGWRDEGRGGVLQNLNTGQQWLLGRIYGNNPICFGTAGNECVAWQASGDYRVQMAPLSEPRRVLVPGFVGRPTGLSHVSADGVVVLIDDVRASVPGLSNPQRAGRVVVGENADAGPNRNIARMDDGREAVLWPGKDSFTPRIATDGGAYAVATWGSRSVRLAILTDQDFRPVVVQPPPPPPLPDRPFVVDPHGVIEDAAEMLFAPNQGPDVHLSPDGNVRMFVKSDERSGDGPDPEIAEHWDLDALNIGHLEDASTGRRILDGKEVIAEDIVRMFPNDHARVWAGLKLNRNTFKDGARLWMPRRCVSGTRIRYVTDIIWTVPPRETPHTRVWKNIPIEIRIDVGYGVIKGKEARLRAAYIPDGNAEVNYYAVPKGFNSWVAGPFSTFEAEWMSSARGLSPRAVRWSALARKQR